MTFYAHYCINISLVRQCGVSPCLSLLHLQRGVSFTRRGYNQHSRLFKSPFAFFSKHLHGGRSKLSDKVVQKTVQSWTLGNGHNSTAAHRTQDVVLRPQFSEAFGTDQVTAVQEAGTGEQLKADWTGKV